MSKFFGSKMFVKPFYEAKSSLPPKGAHFTIAYHVHEYICFKIEVNRRKCKKRTKYASLTNEYLFIPVPIETIGMWRSRQRSTDPKPEY